MAGCSIKSMLYLATFASLPQLWSNPLVCLAYLPTASASLILNSTTLVQSMTPTSSSSSSGGGGGSDKKESAPLLLRIGALCTPPSLLPKSPLTLTYTLLVALYLATAAACWLPEVSQRCAVFVWRSNPGHVGRGVLRLSEVKQYPDCLILLSITAMQCTWLPT